MFPVLPLRAIAFQCLFLLIAIAIEALVLQRALNVPYRKSVEYATSINFLSTALGWILFFSLEPTIPDNLRLQIINCIFFDQWSSNIAAWIIVAGFTTFFISFLIKLSGLDLLKLLLNERDEKKETQEERPRKYTMTPRGSKVIRPPNQANAILIANALSYSAILLVLFVRLVAPTL